MVRFCRVATLAIALCTASSLVLAADVGTTASDLPGEAPFQPQDSAVETISIGVSSAGTMAEESQEETYTRLRNLALSDKQEEALDGMIDLLKEDLSAALRVRVYATATNVAANLEDWSRAFGLLHESINDLDATPEESALLLASASYLHAFVDETDQALKFGLRALELAETSKNVTVECKTLQSLALAEEYARNFSKAEIWRARQIETCQRAGEQLFAAAGKLGFGKLMIESGQPAEALEWTQEALADYQAAGFTAGMYSASTAVARSLIALKREPARADALLSDASEHYRRHNGALATAETERLRAALAEINGDISGALAHLKEAAVFTKEAERDARERRVAYLQVHFDTRIKEQQIALLEAENSLAELRTTAGQRRQLLLVTLLGGLLVVGVLLSIVLRRTFHDRQHFRWKSEHDGLTGLLNHPQMRKQGALAIARARENSSAFTAIAIDIDLFKQVNDYYGHAAGDEVLRSMARWIREAVADHGLAARRGGDEFMILLEADVSVAEAVLRRLRGLIQPVNVLEQTVRFTISAGVCEADAQGTTLEQLMHRADQALYRAKHDGRDRVVYAHESESRAPASIPGLVVVGSGIQFGRHVSERTLSEIRRAEVVFCLVDPFALAMIRGFRPDVINLGAHYAPGKDRRETYREIDAIIMAEVHAGKQVCAVFYGHPGVFADVPHRVIRKALQEGFSARMEPGISAEACLYADLSIDPGNRGVQSMEATHFLYYDRQPDPNGFVLLWQVALSGDLTCSRMHAEHECLEALVEKLRRWYPGDHEVILYEAAQLPIETHRAERLQLRDLPSAQYQEFTTLVIPPLGELQSDPAFARSASDAAEPVSP